MTLQNAHAAFQNGDYKKADEILASLRDISSPDSAIFHLSALTALRRQQPQQALEYIQLALQTPVHKDEVLNSLGRIFQALGEDVQAETAFRQALDVSPNFTLARTNLINQLIDLGDPEKASVELEWLLSGETDNIDYSAALSAAMLDMNETDEALKTLSKFKADEAKACVYRARALFQQGDFSGAIAQSSRAYKDPNYAGQALKLSLQIAAMTGTWGSVSGQVIEEVLSRHPNLDNLWAVAISASYKSGDVHSAQRLFENSPKGPSTLSAQVDYLNGRGNFKSAETLIKKALTLHPGFPAGLAQYCLTLLGLGEYNQAQSVADIALRSSPNNQFYYAIKATAGRKKGQNYGYYFDYKNFVRAYTLSVPQGWKTLADFNQALAEELSALHNFSDAPLDQTLRSGTQTSPNLKFVNSPAIKSFFETVEKPIAEYLSAIGRNKNHPFLRRNSGQFRIRSGWSVLLGAGGHHVNHVHPEGWISSSYYVDVPKPNGREGNIVFGQPPIDMGLKEEHEIKPEPGRLVLFPSYLWHGTIPISGTESRLTLPIDIMPA